MRFFLIHGRHLSGRVQCSHRAATAMWTTMSSGNPIYHDRHLSGRVQCSHWAKTAMWTTMRSGNPIYHDIHLSGRVQCSHWATAVSNVVTGPLPTISIMRTGNPIYELLYEFKLHCHLLGNLSNHFDNNGFRPRETVNIKHYINNSAIWGLVRIY